MRKEQEQELIDAYLNSGKSTAQLKKEFKISGTKFFEILNRSGIARRKEKEHLEKKIEVAEEKQEKGDIVDVSVLESKANQLKDPDVKEKVKKVRNKNTKIKKEKKKNNDFLVNNATPVSSSFDGNTVDESYGSSGSTFNYGQTFSSSTMKPLSSSFSANKETFEKITDTSAAETTTDKKENEPIDKNILIALTSLVTAIGFTNFLLSQQTKKFDEKLTQLNSYFFRDRSEGLEDKREGKKKKEKKVPLTPEEKYQKTLENELNRKRAIAEARKIFEEEQNKKSKNPISRFSSLMAPFGILGGGFSMLGKGIGGIGSAVGGAGAALGGLGGGLLRLLGGGIGLAGSAAGAVGSAITNPANAAVSVKNIATLIMKGAAPGIAGMIIDGILGAFKAKEWNASGIASFFGGFFGGSMKNKIMNTFVNAGKFALLGAGVGSTMGPLGTLVGGLIGTAVGGILGFFGGEQIAQTLDKEVFNAEFTGKMIAKIRFYGEQIMASIFGFVSTFVDHFKNFMGDLIKKVVWIVSNPFEAAKMGKDAFMGSMREFEQFVSKVEKSQSEEYKRLRGEESKTMQKVIPVPHSAETAKKMITSNPELNKIYERMSTQEQGFLLGKHESGNRPEAANIDVDSVSYGKYQYHASRGALAGFMQFLSKSAPDLFKQLESAGGLSEAKNTNLAKNTFAQKWKEIGTGVDKDIFSKLQDAFQIEGLLNPTLNALKAKGMDFTDRNSRLFKEFILMKSNALGISGAANTIKAALSNFDFSQLKSMSDQAIISSIAGYMSSKDYLESKYKTQFDIFKSTMSPEKAREAMNNFIANWQKRLRDEEETLGKLYETVPYDRQTTIGDFSDTSVNNSSSGTIAPVIVQGDKNNINNNQTSNFMTMIPELINNEPTRKEIRFATN